MILEFSNKIYEHHINYMLLPKSRLKVLSRSHAIDVLVALESHKEEGMTFSDLQYNVIKSSSASPLLNALKSVGFIEIIDKKYFITEVGVHSLKQVRAIPDFTIDLGHEQESE